MKPNDPTPAEIEQLTAEIRATWTAAEKMRRLRSNQRPSVMLCDGRPMTMASEDYDRHHDAHEELRVCNIPARTS
jgi:hypothetical protein